MFGDLARKTLNPVRLAFAEQQDERDHSEQRDDPHQPPSDEGWSVVTLIHPPGGGVYGRCGCDRSGSQDQGPPKNNVDPVQAGGRIDQRRICGEICAEVGDA